MKGMPVIVTFCCMQFWITHTACDFEGTHKLPGMCGQHALFLRTASLRKCLYVRVCVSAPEVINN